MSDQPTTSPAPWSVHHLTWSRVNDAHGVMVASYIANPADAQLMCAAPSLVSAVQTAICLLETLPATLHDEEANRVLENLRRAYAHATECSSEG